MHSYPTISESVFVFDLKCGKKYYPDLILCESDPFSPSTYGLASKGMGGKGDTGGKGVWWTPPANNHRKHTLMVFMGLRGAKISPSFPAKTQQ